MSGVEILMAVVALAGTAVSVAGQASAASQQRKMGEYQAKVAEKQAIETAQAAEFEAGKERENTRKLLSMQRARYANAGVTFEGSPLLVMEQTAADAELDAQAIVWGGGVRAGGYQSQAGMSLWEGNTLYQAGMIKAGSTLLTGASKAYSSYSGGSGITVGK
jgi:hypothetical protein